MTHKYDYDETLDCEVGVWKAEKKEKKWYQDTKKPMPCKIISSDPKDNGLDKPSPGKPKKK